MFETRNRLVHAFVASFAAASDAKKVLPTMSATESANLQISYKGLTVLAQEARSRGDIEAATHYETLAINVFARARLAGCAWAGGTSPVN